jgi:hypothetical protein
VGGIVGDGSFFKRCWSDDSSPRCTFDVGLRFHHRVASVVWGDTKKASVTWRQKLNLNGTNGRRTMSAAVRARISRTAKARWAKIRAEKVAGKKKK